MRSLAAPLVLTCALPVWAQTASPPPETGALLGAQRQSDLMFIHGLDDRGGGPLAANQGWLRLGGGKMKSTGDFGGPYTADSDYALLQGGADMPLPWPRGWDHWRVGALASYGNARTDGTAAPGAGTATGRAEGYGLGLTATWFQDTARRRGWYGDFWWQFGWFDNRLTPPGQSRNDYTSHVALASAEGGYAFELAPQWLLTPQLQWVYVHNHAYTFFESNGTEVESAHRGGWTSRLGLRLQRDNAVTPADASAVRYAPYAAVNWWHDSYLGDEVILNGQSIKGLYPNDRFELKGGLAVAMGPRWSAWGDLGWQTGNQSFSAWTAQLGARFSW